MASNPSALRPDAFAALAVGALLAWMIPMPGPAPAPALAELTPPSPLARAVQRRAPTRCVARGESTAEVEALERTLLGLRVRAKLLDGRRAAREGEARPWPDDVPAAESPAGFRQRLDAAIAALPGASVLEVDCEEHPCVAVLIRDRDAGEAGVSADSWAPVAEGLGSAHFSSMTRALELPSADPALPRHVEVHVLGELPDDPDPMLTKRVQFRVARLHESVTAEQVP